MIAEAIGGPLCAGSATALSDDRVRECMRRSRFVRATTQNEEFDTLLREEISSILATRFLAVQAEAVHGIEGKCVELP